MLANPDIGVTQIAHRLGVSPATLYRYIPAARTANIRRLRTPALTPKSRTPQACLVERRQWMVSRHFLNRFTVVNKETDRS
jgi:transposase-like protein